MEEYKCTLSETDLNVAKAELNEVPSERKECVRLLQEWIKEQNNLSCPVEDERFLLLFLRASKFSLLRARDMVKSYLALKTEAPHWFTEIDTQLQRAQEFLDLGYILPLRKRDEKGRKVVILRMGCFDPVAWKDDKSTMLKCLLASTYLLLLDDVTSVYGVLYLMDISDFTLRHKLFWGIDDIASQLKFFQGSFPMRFKAFHCYNEGPMFDALYAMAKPFMSDKFKERVIFHGSSLATVYQHIPMELLPVEYLPEDYQGPHQGSIQDIKDKLKEDLLDEKIQKKIKYWSSTEWGISKASSQGGGEEGDTVSGATFRKLNVD